MGMMHLFGCVKKLAKTDIMTGLNNSVALLCLKRPTLVMKRDVQGLYLQYWDIHIILFLI